MKCKLKYCRGRVYKSSKSPYCSKCRARRWKKAHPDTYAYNKLRYRAIERGHTFTLSLKRFRKLWFMGLNNFHGKTRFSLTVNRIDESIGYTDDNVMLLLHKDNSRKMYIPFFRSKQEEQDAIKEAELAVKEAYNL